MLHQLAFSSQHATRMPLLNFFIACLVSDNKSIPLPCLCTGTRIAVQLNGLLMLQPLINSSWKCNKLTLFWTEVQAKLTILMHQLVHLSASTVC